LRTTWEFASSADDHDSVSHPIPITAMLHEADDMSGITDP